MNPNFSSAQRKAKKSSGSGCFLLIIILLLALTGGAFYSYKLYNSTIDKANSNESTKVSFVIEQGESLDSIRANLVKSGLLAKENEWAFQIYLKVSKKSALIQAGHFNIPKDLNIKELVNSLQDASIPSFWVTIQEGIRIDEVATTLETEFSKQEGAVFDIELFNKYLTDQAFIESLELGYTPTTLEGYLYPDKYLFANDATTEDVLNTIIDTYKAKVNSETTYEQLIIASMVEREAKKDDDRRIVAGIITKRLEEGWFLGIDATLLYYYKDWTYELTATELETDQPYNTRNRIGLTPTPICNPSLSSINAVLEPKDTSYYYYISDSEGNMHYAETLSQHQQNINTYLQ